MGKQVKITSSLFKDFSSKINIEGETYLIDSEDMGIQNPAIITRIYHKGKIIYSHTTEYKDIIHEPDWNERLRKLIQDQKQVAIETLKKEKTSQKKVYKEYLAEVVGLIKINKQDEALHLLNEASTHYPNNPLILSYRGYLEAVVNKYYFQGEMLCEDAFKVLKEQMPLCESFFLPLLYLNLGKVYAAANNRKTAYNTLKKGLEIDNANEELLNEITKLGIRRKPLIPFIKRSNPINKYLGKLLYKLKK